VNIKCNEKVDTLAKEASTKGEIWNNISCDEIISSLNLEYTNINNKFYLSKSESVDSYYLKNFREININFIRKILNKKEDCEILTRLITGYGKTIFAQNEFSGHTRMLLWRRSPDYKPYLLGLSNIGT